MARGNWQRRIELTDARRAAAKLHKENRRNGRQQRSNSTSGGGGWGDDVVELVLRLGGLLDGMTMTTRRDDGSGGDGDGDGDGDVEGDSPPRADGRKGASEGYPDAAVAVDIWTDRVPAGRREYDDGVIDVEIDGDRDGDDDDDGDDCPRDRDADGDGRRDASGGGGKSKFDGARFGKRTKGRAHPNANAGMKDGGSGSGGRDGGWDYCARGNSSSGGIAARRRGSGNGNGDIRRHPRGNPRRISSSVFFFRA
jgi:hypothetical protein